MKNLLLLGVALFAAYLYMHPRTEVQEVVKPVVQAPPPPPPKMYYHSPLDASAMPTNYSTGTGYYSTDAAASRFNGQVAGGAYASRTVGASVYYGGGGSVSNTVIYNGTGQRATSVARPSPADNYVARPRSTYPANASSGQLR